MSRYDPDQHHRRSIRLKDYDYRQNDACFVTICAHDRACLFGDIVGYEMRLNALGRVVESCGHEIPAHFPHVELDAFVIMPTHVHGIIVVVDSPVGTRHMVGTRHAVSLPPQTESFGKPVPGSLPTIMRSFKAAVTKRINEIRGTPGAPVWQGRFYEHSIRSEKAQDRIRDYILDNPARWAWDRENPVRGIHR